MNGVFAVCLAYILIQLWQGWSLILYHRKQSGSPKNHLINDELLPSISIWVACRNEEANIAKCLESLLQLQYPPDKIQILVGNDQSTDRSREIISECQEKDPQSLLIDILDNDTGLKAKARVMAQLDQHAKGDFYLITDADVQVNPKWVQGLLSALNPSIGVASGTTMVKSEGWSGKMQEIDWTYFMGLLNLISANGIPATAVGNNMIIRKEAYWETGGYSAIKFSITEDYKLYSEVCNKGWGWNNVMNPKVKAYTAKIDGFIPLLHQRKRWLSGGKELPWYWWLLFGIFGLFFPAILVSFCLNWKFSTGIWLVKFILQSRQINTMYKLLGEPIPSLKNHVHFEFYLLITTISTAIFFILPVATNWKGRKY